ncbi:hypothetical protein K435DRAFT_792301 [Dendrothele bispora CBS 962.96]|uniref:Uncharacterized protein n=1 Tax=Dendrothele bispora (strain CBS 962.96) TaxID=1314807 RepID=A0A4S8MIY9_DENBC|nr:hypothetical protein K435DRAFT_792301 [Dendrothele bispora CBS 962.96]
MLFISLLDDLLGLETNITQIPLFAHHPPDPINLSLLLEKLLIGGGILGKLNYAISDIIVVWRAWVLFPHKMIIKITLLICLMATFVGTFLAAGPRDKDPLGNQIGFFALEISSEEDGNILHIYGILMPELSALYPILIILMVAHENSRPDNANGMSLSQSMQFASAQVACSEESNFEVTHHADGTGTVERH